MQKDWIEVEGYPNYVVSNFGDVMNLQTDRLLKPRESDRGYLRVTLSDAGDKREFYVHKLVGNAFYGYSYDEHTIHYDGDHSNNHVSNLRLKKRVKQQVDIQPLEGTETEEYRRQWGRRIRIVETGEIFRTVRDCAKYINGDYSSIYGCLRGDRKSHRGFTFEYYELSERERRNMW